MGTKTRAARKAKNAPALQGLARVGYAVNGLLHLLIGVLAISIAIGSGSGDADQAGALAQLAESPGGSVLLWVIVVGLAALGLWLLLQSILLPSTGKKGQLGKRLVGIAKALVYVALAGTALVFARGGSTDSSDTTTDFSAALLKAPGGVFLLIAVGLLVVGIGAYFVHKGVTKKFLEDLRLPSGTAGRVARVLGIAGYVAKGIALVVVGMLFVVAAMQADPDEATGLDGALKALAELPFGIAVLVAVGAGLVAYGLYCFLRAWRARLN